MNKMKGSKIIPEVVNEELTTAALSSSVNANGLTVSFVSKS